MVQVGEKAPDFELPSTIGEKVRLSESLGKPVVLAFYFLDFSPVCANELCGFQNSLKAFENLDTKVFGISVDSIFAHKAFAEQNKLTFPLLSDFNKEVSKAYGVLYDVPKFGFKNVTKRSVFILDSQGVVRYRWETEDPANPPNLEEIKSNLKKL